ncbi:hypothetical protein MFAL_11960 [Mycolicibacterium fallax]|nr:hypothetical protein MFAL_11960 [Mycolicibacterium fallax]
MAASPASFQPSKATTTTVSWSSGRSPRSVWGTRPAYDLRPTVVRNDAKFQLTAGRTAGSGGHVDSIGREALQRIAVSATLGRVKDAFRQGGST